MASRFEAEKFTGKNDFSLWRMKMRAMLIQQGLSDALTPASKEGEGQVLDEKAKVKRAEILAKAHSTVVLCLGDKVLREVAKETTAAGILERLEDLYMTKSLANRLFMKQRLYSYRFSEERNIIEQLEDFDKAVDDLENIDVSIGDEDKAIMLLNALPKSYDQLRDAILFGREGTVTLLEVQNALRAKELQRKGSKVTEAVPESLNIKKFKNKKNFKKPECSKPSTSDQKESRSCFWCKKPGHLKKDCFVWKKRLANEAAQGKNTTDFVEENSDSPEILNIMAYEDGGSWILDSGCSFHICPCKEFFTDLREATGTVILGNNQVCHVEGMGNVRLRLDDGSEKILSDVRLIPTVKRNLISLGMLEKKGCTFESSDGVMKIKRNSVVIMLGERRGSLYYLCGGAVKAESDQVNHTTPESLRVWHMRLGHPADGSVKELAKRGLIPDVDAKVSKPCEECILGKSKKLPYPKGKHSSQSPLDYAHSDLWGPAPVNSVGGGKYYMSIIDDYSRKMWLYILKVKSEAFARFKDWCVLVEKEKGRSLGCLRTDNGLEFLSKEFDSFCLERGIKRHRTAPLNPQQNGVAERANRTILERVRCMLLSSGMEKRFWAEAAATAVRLINKCPSSAIDGDIPDFRWYGRHSDYANLKIFGCQAYAHVKQSKLDARALRCVFLGYQSGVKGFRLWCIEPGNHKIIVSRDVVFTESLMPLKRKQDGEKIVVSGEQTAAWSEVESGGVTQGEADESDEESTHDKSSADTGDLSQYLLARDRARRSNIGLPARFADSEMLYFALCVAEEVEFGEPANYKEAMECKERSEWLKAMIEEVDSLLKNGTWILVDRVEGRRIVSCKWIFKKKLESADNKKIRFKARLVARGFTQEQGVDYSEVFSPVVKHASIRILLAVVARLDWELEQLDVKTAFLHGDLVETIYMQQPEGFEKVGEENKVCLLKKSIYGLKQASRQWHLKFDDHVLRNGFIRSKYDECVYIKKKEGKVVAYLLLYVDDMLVAGSCKRTIQEIKDDLRSAFDMKDLGSAKRILGMNIVRNRAKREIWLNQSDYISRLVRKFKMEESKAVSTPLAQHFRLSVEQSPKTDEERVEMEKIPYANVVGSIMYAMIGSRPDVAQAISVTSRYMSDHGKDHWLALKWILKYLNGAGDVGILYRAETEVKGDALVGYCDSDYAGNIDTRKSQSGYIFTLYGGAISWKSGLQSVVALSTTEAEYIALTSAVKESFWLKGIAADFGVIQSAVAIGCDSSSALALAKNNVFHERSKHIDVRLHFIREEIEKGKVKVFKISTLDNPADMLTKVLPKEKFEQCLRLVGMCRGFECSANQIQGGEL